MEWIWEEFGREYDQNTFKNSQWTNKEKNIEWRHKIKQQKTNLELFWEKLVVSCLNIHLLGNPEISVLNIQQAQKRARARTHTFLDL